MDVLGREPDRAPHDDLFAVFVPFHDRPRADAKLSTNAGGNRDLPLRRDLGMSRVPYLYITTVMHSGGYRSAANQRAVGGSPRAAYFTLANSFARVFTAWSTSFSVTM